MLNRLRDALEAPQAVSAASAATAPLWVELSAAEVAQRDQQRRKRDQVAAAELAEEKRKKSETARRIARDVERALQPDPGAAALAPESQVRRAGSSTSSTRDAATSDDPTKSHVASDVRRVLAEVFGDQFETGEIVATAKKESTGASSHTTARDLEPKEAGKPVAGGGDIVSPESLGAGWLNSPATGDESSPTVPTGHDQLHDGDRSELGPAWAALDEDAPADAPDTQD